VRGAAWLTSRMLHVKIQTSNVRIERTLSCEKCISGSDPGCFDVYRERLCKRTYPSNARCNPNTSGSRDTSRGHGAVRGTNSYFHAYACSVIHAFCGHQTDINTSGRTNRSAAAAGYNHNRHGKLQ